MGGDTFTFNTSCPTSGDHIYPLLPYGTGSKIPDTDLKSTSSSKIYQFFPGGLIKTGYDNTFTNGEWGSTISNYLSEINNPTTGTESGKKLSLFTSGSNTNSNLTQANDLLTSDQRTKDMDLSNRIQMEYCFYKSRYHVLLEHFLKNVAPGSVGVYSESQQVDLLAALIEINKRMNALVKLVKQIGDNRIASLNTYTNALNLTNEQINASIASLTPTSDLLSQNDAISHTRKEMVRFTKEKNNAITNQITLWASLNVVAIGIIFHIYRNM